MLVRPGTSDVLVVFETFIGCFHLPPEEAPNRPLRILDLGSNIGLTAAHFAELYADARVLGVELNNANAALARWNVSAYGDRCRILEGAVWGAHDELVYDDWPGHEYVFRVDRTDRSSGSVRAANVVTVGELIEQLAPGGRVDYVKMDIEGAERDVLTRNTDWATRVCSMKVEVHEPYSRERCLRDLERLGFKTRLDDRRTDCVIAVRE